jgi:hypothetical protein
MVFSQLLREKLGERFGMNNLDGERGPIRADRGLADTARSLHEIFLWAVEDSDHEGPRLVFRYLRKLAEFTEGWRIAILVRDIDRRSGNHLKRSGIKFDQILERKADH